MTHGDGDHPFQAERAQDMMAEYLPAGTGLMDTDGGSWIICYCAADYSKTSLAGHWLSCPYHPF